MGYSHYFSYDPDSPAFRAVWPRMREDAARIFDHVESLGVRLVRDVFNNTLQSRFEVIGCNGDPDAELDCEDLVITPRWPVPWRFSPGRVRRFCKTNRYPYDLAVTSVLLRCHRLLPAEFAIYSSGDWDREWRGEFMPGELPGPRQVVAELFGDTSPDDPLDKHWYDIGQ